MTSREVHWPSFFIVGAPKSGTTSLYFHLKRHPQIFLPANKEPKYFMPHLKESVSLREYRRLYSQAEGFAAIGDASATYLMGDEVPERIREVRPDARIVAILRDPVERAYSDFLFALSRGEESETSFAEVLRRYQKPTARHWHMSRYYIQGGMYDEQVRRYQQVFGAEQVLVLLFEELKNNPRNLFIRLASHIGANPGFFATADFSESQNPYRMPKSMATRAARRLRISVLVPEFVMARLRPLFFDTKKPTMDNESRSLLQKIYEPSLARLEDLLGRKFPELRKSWV